MKQLISKIKHSIVEKKEDYEARKAQEREKRRFAILSGTIESIATHYTLQQGEQVY